MSGSHDRFVDVDAVPFGFGDRPQNPLVVARHHLREMALLCVPVGQDPLSHGGIRGLDVGADDALQPVGVAVVEGLGATGTGSSTVIAPSLLPPTAVQPVEP